MSKKVDITIRHVATAMIVGLNCSLKPVHIWRGIVVNDLSPPATNKITTISSKDVTKNVFAMGGSAGGLLMGAVINMEPELYTGIISAVPFVDVVTTMSDESIPLTTFEYKEWGNPANKEEYDYIKSYSPYDNIKPSNYPAVLVTSSLYDSQVQYYEPAKYVPKLRENSTSDNPILMKMNLVGGHAGKSGRLNALEESALDNTFLINLVSND